MLYSILLFVILSTPAQAQWHRQAFQTLGTQAYIEYWTEDSTKAEQLINQVQAEFERHKKIIKN